MGVSAASLSEMWGEVQRAAGAMERLVELACAPSRTSRRRPLPVAAAAAHSRGRIQFEHVTFRYPSRPEVAALDDFTLTIEPGETVAFVGPSGAGKSTTFQLLLRFYDPASGRVLIDGVDIAQRRPERRAQADRARAAGHGAVRRVGAREHPLRPARARPTPRSRRPRAPAEADEFLRELPQGYDTFLGERGMRLSGGQRQRIAIARAILKDPPILLLDEATSSLDAQSELLVQQALERLMRDRTTIIIAHRLATVLEGGSHRRDESRPHRRERQRTRSCCTASPLYCAARRAAVRCRERERSRRRPMRLWSVEGNRQRLDGGAMFGNVPRALWQQWLRARRRESARVRVPLPARRRRRRHHGVVRDRHRRVLQSEASKARFGVHEHEHVLLRSLAERGVAARGRRRRRAEPSALRSCGRFARRRSKKGSPPRLLFPNARFVVSRTRVGARARAASARSRVVHPRAAGTAERERPARARRRAASRVARRRACVRVQRRPHAGPRARDRRR